MSRYFIVGDGSRNEEKYTKLHEELEKIPSGSEFDLDPLCKTLQTTNKSLAKVLSNQKALVVCERKKSRMLPAIWRKL